MLQAIIKKGKVVAQKIPAPISSPGYVLIKVKNSCISAGTEMTGVKKSGTSLYKRAIEEPENVKKIISYIKKEGIFSTINPVINDFVAGAAPGYEICVEVYEVGEGVDNFCLGDRVAAAGAGMANHAEYVAVPKSLVIHVPENLSFDEAATVTLGGIAIQGVRRADLKLGEFAVVFGSGILGLLTIQMLKVSGIRVAAIDISDKRLLLAKELGAELILNPLKVNCIHEISNWTNGYGADAVIFTAATNSNKPLSDSFQMTKKKGKVILVGVVGMEINREDIYPKELDFLISTSYGPGRYDRLYEQLGIDYPYSYVRWTETRNMEEYLRLLSINAIKLELLISAHYAIEDIGKAFDSFSSLEDKPLMVIIDYKNHKYSTTLKLDNQTKESTNKKILNVGLIGLGGFAQATHIPNLIKLKEKYYLHTIVDRTGLKARNLAEQYKIPYIETDYKNVIKNPDIDVVFICTRHSDHAKIALEALNEGKNVFLEKPMAINDFELVKYNEFFKMNLKKPILMVGYNRRYSHAAAELKALVENRKSPILLYYRMNAGYLSKDHWTHEDGGRIVGEACHIIDLFSFLVESKVNSINIENLTFFESKYYSNDNKVITIKYQDGSVGTIHYFSIGNISLPKEYLEVHFEGKSFIVDNYESISIHDSKPYTKKTEGKGHLEELLIFYNSVANSNPPIQYDSLLETAQLAFEAR